MCPYSLLASSRTAVSRRVVRCSVARTSLTLRVIPVYSSFS